MDACLPVMFPIAPGFVRGSRGVSAAVNQSRLTDAALVEQRRALAVLQGKRGRGGGQEQKDEDNITLPLSSSEAAF